jgi:NADH:ubiquinone oxidoreductase subunit 6 (subunit J)
VKDDVKLVIAAAIFLTLVFGVVSLDLRPAFSGGAPRVATLRAWEQAPAAGEDPVAVAQFMFGPYALAFEVLSVVLLVALIGALFIAKPEPPEALPTPAPAPEAVPGRAAAPRAAGNLATEEERA